MMHQTEQMAILNGSVTFLATEYMTPVQHLLNHVRGTTSQLSKHSRSLSEITVSEHQKIIVQLQMQKWISYTAVRLRVIKKFYLATS
jgi:hypothetical protein